MSIPPPFLPPTPDLDPSDEDLVLALQNGQEWALEILFNRYSQLVYTAAYKILANVEEAQDLVQEVFLTLWKQTNYNPDRGSLKTFLMMQTRSRALDQIRSRGSRSRLLHRWTHLVQADEISPSLLDKVEQGERSYSLQQCLTQLKSIEREILEIAYYEGMSQAEIARRLNLPLGTVKTHSRQGLIKLRKLLKDLI